MAAPHRCARCNRRSSPRGPHRCSAIAGRHAGRARSCVRRCCPWLALALPATAPDAPDNRRLPPARADAPLAESAMSMCAGADRSRKIPCRRAGAIPPLRRWRAVPALRAAQSAGRARQRSGHRPPRQPACPSPRLARQRWRVGQGSMPAPTPRPAPRVTLASGSASWR